MKRWLALVLVWVGFAAHAAPTTLSEGFNNLATSGWTIFNNSAPGGTTSWFQGNSGVFQAQGGPANSYAAANFLNAPITGGPISTWLISPELTFASQLLSFFVRTTTDSPFNDGLRVYVSNNGSSTDINDFSLLLSINGGNQPAGFPDDWTQFTAGLLASGNGRIAFEYFVEDGLFADYIGLDTVSITLRTVAEPGTLILVALSLAAAGLARRRTAGRSV